jgi:hypothetical protein
MQRDTAKPFDKEEHTERQSRQKRSTPRYKSYQEVRITRKVGIKREEKVAAFAREHIAEYHGLTEEHGRVPHMLFERPADAHAFAHKLHSKLVVPKEHIEVKAQEVTEK